MFSNLLFVRFLVGVNVSGGLILMKLLLYVLSIAYAVYYLLGEHPPKLFPGLYTLVCILILVPFLRAFIWKHIDMYRSMIGQLYSDDQVWWGVLAFGSLSALFIGGVVLFLLKFFGLAYLLNTEVLLVAALMLLSIQSVIQFCSTLLVGFSDRSLTWLYLLSIPLSIPVFSTTLAAWKKATALSVIQDQGMTDETMWLLGIFVFYTALSYLLFNIVWKS